MDRGAWWAAVHGVAKSQTGLSNFTFTFHFHALEKEMATHSSVLAWKIPGMAEPGGLQSMGSHRVGHDWSDLAAAARITTNDNAVQSLARVWFETSQMVQWMRICLPVKGARVWPLVRDEHLSLCTTTTEPRALTPRAETPEAHMPKACGHKRSHCNEKPAYCNKV